MIRIPVKRAIDPDDAGRSGFDRFHWREDIVEGEPGGLVLCHAEMLRYFDVPYNVVEMTVVLRTGYSEGTCYEFRAPNGIPDIMIEGKRYYVALFGVLDEAIAKFIEKHGKCFLSLEFTS